MTTINIRAWFTVLVLVSVVLSIYFESQQLGYSGADVHTYNDAYNDAPKLKRETKTKTRDEEQRHLCRQHQSRNRKLAILLLLRLRVPHSIHRSVLLPSNTNSYTNSKTNENTTSTTSPTTARDGTEHLQGSWCWPVPTKRHRRLSRNFL